MYCPECKGSIKLDGYHDAELGLECDNCNWYLRFNPYKKRVRTLEVLNSIIEQLPQSMLEEDINAEPEWEEYKPLTLRDLVAMQEGVHA